MIIPIKKEKIPTDWSKEFTLKKFPIPEKINSELIKNRL